MISEKGEKSESELPYEETVCGYGIYESGTRTVVLMGGFKEKAMNEDKINRHFYYIREEKESSLKRTFQYPKSSSKYFESEKISEKKYLSSFVYGVPLGGGTRRKLINTNGYYVNLNNSNRIFLSELVNAPREGLEYGISAQEVLVCSDEESVLDKNLLLKIVVDSCNKINRYKSEACL